MIKPWDAKKFFWEAKTIRVVFSSQPGLHYNKIARQLEIYLNFPPGTPITDSMIARSLSCKPPQYTRKATLAIVILSILLFLVFGRGEAGLAAAALIASLFAILGSVAERIVARLIGSQCSNMFVMPPSEYKELVTVASRIMAECAREGSCQDVIEVAGRRMKYAAWKPSRLALLLGIAETVIFAVEEGKGWGGGGVGAG